MKKICLLGGFLTFGWMLYAFFSFTQSAAPIPVFEGSDTVFEKANDEESGTGVKIAFAALFSPRETFFKYQGFKDYFEQRLGRKVEVVIKPTYAEVNALLKDGTVDFGFICSLSYVLGTEERAIRALAAPVMRNKTRYRSYIICRADSGIDSIADLKGKRFAFTDPLSYTGRLAALEVFMRAGLQPDKDFSQLYFTYSHDYSIQAVELKVADAAAVDSLVYDELADTRSDHLRALKIIGRGELAGMPPVVVSEKADPALAEAFQRVLFHMHEDPEGRKLLEELHIDRYQDAEEDDYEVIRRALSLLGGSVHAAGKEE